VASNICEGFTLRARELATCEMDALYYTDGFAIDAGKIPFPIPAPPSEAAVTIPSGISATLPLPAGRGLHSSTLKPNVSAYCGTGGAHRGCLGVV